MRKLVEKMKSLVRDDEGATIVEYAILVALIAVACVVVITTLSGKIQDTFTEIADKLPGTGGGTE